MATSFFQAVYQLVDKIPAGKVATYGQLAAMLGRHRAAKMVGWAMRQAPDGLPCHRVVKRDGQLAPDAIFPEQRKRLLAEGVSFTQSGQVRLDRHLWQAEPDPADVSAPAESCLTNHPPEIR